MKHVMKIALLALAMTACSSGTGGDERAAAIDALTGDAAAGATLFGARCASCHAADGSGGTGPDLQPGAAEIRGGSEEENSEYINILLSGKGGMPSFASLSDQELADLMAHVTTLGS
jgi:mono/diheme cytochrome c family protein